MKLRSKISLSILCVVFVIFLTVLSYVALTSSEKAKKDAEMIAIQTIRMASRQIQAELNTEMNLVTNLGHLIGGMDTKQSNVRDAVLNLVRTAAASSSTRTICVWFAFEPNAFDGRDAEFANTEWYGASGQFIASFVDNRNGTADRTHDVTAETVNNPDTGLFYLTPLKTGEPTITEPEHATYKSGMKTLMSHFSMPISRDGKVIGVVGLDLDFTEVQALVAKLTLIGNNSGIQLIANGGTIIYAPQADRIGRNISEVLKGQVSINERISAIREGRENISYEYSALTGSNALKAYTPVQIGSTRQYMSVNAQIPVEDMLVETRAMTRNTIAAAVAGLLLLVVFIVWVVGRVVKPIIAISTQMKQASEMDFKTDHSKTWLLRYRDEIGMMACAYRNLQVSLTRVFHTLNEESESFASTAQHLAAISQESVASMEEVKASVDEAARLSELNYTMLKQANINVEEVSHSAAATANLAEIGAAAAGRTAQLTQDAALEVNQMLDKIHLVDMRSTDSGESIRKVNMSVDIIADFVLTITGIANQTNLLALNAAIEAARAGEAGRGFAVVAEEVRKLAEESGDAAKEIEKLISALQADTTNANTVIQEMGIILGETVSQATRAQEKLAEGLKEVNSLDGNMQTIAAAAEEQAAASSEMANSVAKSTEATTEVANTLNNIKSATENTAEASENVAGEAQSLSSGVNKLQTIIGMFQYDDKQTNEQNRLKLSPGKRVNH